MFSLKKISVFVLAGLILMPLFTRMWEGRVKSVRHGHSLPFMFMKEKAGW